MPHRILPKKSLSNARSLRRNMTEAEKKMWYRLRAHRLNGVSFKRQAPVAPYIVDFVCLQARLIVEIDGGQHGSETDAARDAWLSKQGFRVLRFWNNDVHSNIEGVMQTNVDALAQAIPPSLTLPRKGGGNASDFAETSS